MVDSRATTARPVDNASETSGATFTLIDPPIAALDPAAYSKQNPFYTLLINLFIMIIIMFTATEQNLDKFVKSWRATNSIDDYYGREK